MVREVVSSNRGTYHERRWTNESDLRISVGVEDGERRGGRETKEVS